VLLFLAHLIARYVLSSLNISSGGTKFEIFREHVGYLYFVLLRRARLFDLLLQVMLLVITGVIYLCPASPEIAVAFLVESYESVLKRRSYASWINFIELFVLPVCSFWNCKCRCSRASLWTFLRVVYDIVWFCSGKRSEFRSSSYDCSSSSTLWLSLLLFAMLSGFLETVNSLYFVRRLVVL